MEVFKKILSQALKVCTIWNYFYFFTHASKVHFTQSYIIQFYGTWGRPVVVVGVVGVEWFLHGLGNLCPHIFQCSEATDSLILFSRISQVSEFSLPCFFKAMLFFSHSILNNLYLGCRDKEKAFNGNHRTVTIRISKAIYILGTSCLQLLWQLAGLLSFSFDMRIMVGWSTHCRFNCVEFCFSLWFLRQVLRAHWSSWINSPLNWTP